MTRPRVHARNSLRLHRDLRFGLWHNHALDVCVLQQLVERRHLVALDPVYVGPERGPHLLNLYESVARRLCEHFVAFDVAEQEDILPVDAVPEVDNVLPVRGLGREFRVEQVELAGDELSLSPIVLAVAASLVRSTNLTT